MRSAKLMNGRVFAGARALYRAAGVDGTDFGKKPIIAIANSFDEFLPGHVHLNKVGRLDFRCHQGSRRHSARVQHDGR